MRYLVSAVLLAAGLAACAPTTPPTPPGQPPAARVPNRCFRTDQIRNFRFDNTRLFVRSTQNDVHEIGFIGGCRLNTTTTIKIANWMPWLRQVCVGDRVTVSSRTQRGISCQARVSRSLSDEEIAALSPRQRP
jgi:hypothetical protein